MGWRNKVEEAEDSIDHSSVLSDHRLGGWSFEELRAVSSEEEEEREKWEKIQTVQQMKAKKKKKRNDVSSAFVVDDENVNAREREMIDIVMGDRERERENERTNEKGRERERERGKNKVAREWFSRKKEEDGADKQMTSSSSSSSSSSREAEKERETFLSFSSSRFHIQYSSSHVHHHPRFYDMSESVWHLSISSTDKWNDQWDMGSQVKRCMFLRWRTLSSNIFLDRWQWEFVRLHHLFIIVPRRVTQSMKGSRRNIYFDGHREQRRQIGAINVRRGKWSNWKLHL